jgi:hypothetical protein
VQTFLPSQSFEESVKCLDYRRLGKQRVEALQLIKAIEDPSYGWRKHPATQMWINHKDALGLYMNICIEEWVSRGYKNTMKKYSVPGGTTMPPWLGDKAFHLSHKSNLIRKLPEHYGKLWPGVPNDLPYVWPK